MYRVHVVRVSHQGGVVVSGTPLPSPRVSDGRVREAEQQSLLVNAVWDASLSGGSKSRTKPELNQEWQPGIPPAVEDGGSASS